MKKFRWIVVLTAITALLSTGIAYAGQGNSNGINGNINGDNGGESQAKDKTIKVDITQAYSQNKDQNINKKGGSSNGNSQGYGPGESAQMLREQIRERKRIITENEAECDQLKQRIRERCRNLKNCIEQQRAQDRIHIDLDQASEIEESLQMLEGKSNQLRDERYCHQKQIARMNRNKRAGNKTALVEDLDEIIKVQNDRINALEDTYKGLNEMQVSLSK